MPKPSTLLKAQAGKVTLDVAGRAEIRMTPQQARRLAVDLFQFSLLSERLAAEESDAEETLPLPFTPLRGQAPTLLQ